MNILAAWRRGERQRTDPDTERPYRRHAAGECVPSDHSDYSKPGVWKSAVWTGMGTCTFACTYLHERVHKRQCERNPFSSFGWYQYRNDDDEAAKIEIPAYEKELPCYDRFIADADAAKRRSGSYEKACECCKASRK